MEYHLEPQLSEAKTECLVIGLLEEMPFSEQIQSLDKKLGGLIHRLYITLQTPGQMRVQSEIDGRALVLIHCGKLENYEIDVLEKHLKSGVQYVLAQHYTNASFAFPNLSPYDPNQQLQSVLQIIDKTCYVQTQFKSKPKPQALTQVYIHQAAATEHALNQGIIVAESIAFTRRLADLPANFCTPTQISKAAEQLSKSTKHLHCRVLHKKELETLKMGGLLAVSQGSVEPPCFIELKYQNPAATKAPIVLIGKGITFDSGGISIKPAANMNEMKYDMAGAASVMGAVLACAKLELPLHVIALMPCAENMPSGEAVKPGDVITMMSKHTVEVLNTDAEGRLILADALTYAEQFKPACVIDVATLTGAVIVALGNVASGFMTHDEALAEQIHHAALKSNDKAWRLPLFKAYEEGLESPVADMINAGFDRAAGSIFAGMFLSKFAKAYPWVHLDVAGTAWVSGNKRVSTGRPVPLLVEFLRHASQAR